MCDFSQTRYVLVYAMLSMTMFLFCLFFWKSFCGLYCPNFVFLACWGTWRCEHTRYCVRKLSSAIYKIFTHSFTSEYRTVEMCLQVCGFASLSFDTPSLSFPMGFLKGSLGVLVFTLFLPRRTTASFQGQACTKEYVCTHRLWPL